MADNNFYLKLQGELDKAKSQIGITQDIKDIEKQVESLKIQAKLDEKSVQNIIKQLNNVLNQKVTVGNGIGEGIQKSVEASLQNTKKLISDTFKSLPKLNASDLISKFNLNSKDIDASVVSKVRDLTNELNKLASEVVKTNSDNAWMGLIENARKLGAELNNFGKIKADTSQYEQILRVADELRKSKIYVDPSIKNDVLAGANVSSLKELNNELISMGVAFTSAATGAKNLDSVWEEFINSTNRSDLGNITNSADKITTVIEELRKAREVLYGDKAYQSANGYGSEEMVNWINSIEQASKKMDTYQKEEIQLEKQLAEVVVQSEQKKQNAIEQTQKTRQKQSGDNTDNSAKNEKKLLDFDARRAKILQEISTYLSQNSKLTASNTAEARTLQGNFERIRQEVQSISRGDNVGLSTLSKQLSTAKLKAKELKVEGSSLSDEFGKLFKRFNSWFSVGQLSFAVTNKVQDAIQEIKQLDSILTEISKTSDLTDAQLSKLGDTAFDTASKYGRTASDYLTGVQEMYRAGFQNAEQMAELSVLAQSAGDMNAEMANNYLIATNSAYDLKGNVESLNEILDSQNFITNNAALSMNDMGQATSKAASIAAQSGVKINELSALIATGVSQTKKSGDEVGNAIKSIFVNLQNTQSDKIVKTFDSVGISMTKVINGAERLKTPIELIKELAKVYNSLEEGSPLRANIVTNLAGKYQANVFSSILSGIDDYEKMLKLYSEGSGSAMVEAQKSASTLEAALNRINNTITDIVDNVLGSQLLTDSANGLNDILSLVNQLTDKLGTLGTISVIGAGIVGANKKSAFNLSNIISQYKDLSETVNKYNTLTSNARFSSDKFNASLKNNNTMMGEYLVSLNGAKASFGGYIQHLATAKISTVALSAATTAMNMALSMGTAYLVSSAITALAEWVNKAEEAREKSTELSDSWKADNSSLEDSISQYKKLSEKLNDASLSTEEVKSVKEQLTSIQDELNQKYGDEADSIDLVNGKYDEQIKKLDALSKKKAQDYIAENGSNVKEDKKYLSKVISGDNTTDMARYNTNLGDKEAEKQYKQAEATYKKYFKKYNALSLGYDYYKGTTGLRLNLKGTRDQIQKQLSQLFAELNADYKGNPPEFIQGLKDVITETLNMDDFDTTKIENAKNNIKTYTEAEILANSKTRNLYNDSVEAVEEYNNALSSGKGIDAAKKNLDDIKQKVSETIKGYEGYDAVFADIFDSIQKTDGKIEQKTSEVKNSVSKKDTLSFKDALKSDDNKEIAKELKTLAEAGELTPNTLTSTKEYNKLLKETKTSAQEATEELYNMVDANTRLSAFSNNMDAVDKAYAEFKTNKFNTMDTLSGLEGAFGDLSYYEKFIQIAGNAKSSTEQIQQAYNKLVTEYVYSTGILDTVNESNKGLIQTQLEHLGITNAEELVTKALNGEMLSLSNAKSILAQYGLKLTNVTSGELNALVKEGNVSKNTAQQLALFALKKKIASGVTLTTDGDIRNLVALAGVSSKVIQLMTALANVKKQIQENVGEALTPGGKERLQSEAKRLEKDIQDELRNGAKINTTKYTGGDATIDAIDKATNKAKKTVTKFSKTIDWCAKTLDKLSKSIDLYNAKLDNTTNSIDTQIKYYKKLLNIQNSVVKGYSTTEGKYKKQYNNALKKLSKSDKKKVQDGTYSIEQFKGKAKSGSTSKEEKRYNNIQKALEARDTYLEAQTDLVNAKNQLQDYAEALASIRWDDAAKKVEKLNNELDVLESRMSNVSGYKAKNKVLQQELNIQKQILQKQQDAYKKTQSDANAYYKKISAKNKKNKNASGTISTKGVTDKTQLKYIKTYNAYVRQLATSTTELAKAQEEYNNAVINASVTRAENIKTEYDNKLSLVDAKKSKLESDIALAEAKGQVASTKYYELLNQNSTQRLEMLNDEKSQLEEQLSSVRKYSDAWYEVKNAVNDLDDAIATETQNSVENIQKQIEATNKLADAKNDYITSISDSLSWFESLVNEEDYYDDNGEFTDKGLAVLQSKLGRIEASRTRQENIQGKINELDEKYRAGQITEAYWVTERTKLEKELQDEISNRVDIQKEANDMYIKSLEAQSNALKDIIDKKKKALDLDKSERDYQKSIAEKTKNIADLQKQLAMLKGDNSEEAKAQRQQIEVQLKEVQEDLDDTQYDKYIERYEDAMDSLTDRLDELIEKLDNLTPEEAENNAKEILDGKEANVENGKNEVFAGIGQSAEEFKKINTVLSGSATTLEGKFDSTNDWLSKIYDAMPEEETGKGDNGQITLSEALGKYDKNNQKKDTTNKSALNKYIMSQGYSAKNEKQMLDLTTAILQSPYSEGMNTDLYSKLSEITNTDQLKSDKDANATDNKNAIMHGLQYVRAKEFIDKNATKAKKKQSEYGTLNKKIYDITKGKVLSKANTLKLGSLFNVNDSNGNNVIDGAEAKKLVKLLENAGFSNGGIVKAVKKNGDDGLASLSAGEAVLKPAEATALMKLSDKLVPLNNMMDIFQRPNIPTNIQRNGDTSSTTIDSVNFEFNLPNVVDSESLIKTIQTDSKVQRTLQNATVGKLNGNTRFGVNRL